VIHAGAPELAQQVKKLLMATFSEEHIVMAEAGPVLGTHTGPETVGIAWVNGRY
jgi:fatty acid-binding protein DegV